MNKSDACFNCNGLQLNYSFLYPETRRYFKNYLTEADPLSDCDKDVDPVCETVVDIRVTPEYMEENRWLVDEDEECMPFLEFQSLMLATGNALLSHGRALFHGVALLWKERAWIITAPSGTGKTTQLRHWKRILGKGVSVINGDKPLLECQKDGSVLVHSSPWQGKERLGIQGLSAPLGGIIFLKQGAENTIRRLDPKDAVRPLFVEFVSFPEDTDQILCQAKILEQMLNVVPVWELTNLGDEDSARLTQATLEAYLREEALAADQEEGK